MLQPRRRVRGEVGIVPPKDLRRGEQIAGLSQAALPTDKYFQWIKRLRLHVIRRIDIVVGHWRKAEINQLQRQLVPAMTTFWGDADGCWNIQVHGIYTGS